MLIRSHSRSEQLKVARDALRLIEGLLRKKTTIGVDVVAESETVEVPRSIVDDHPEWRAFVPSNVRVTFCIRREAKMPKPKPAKGKQR